MNPPSRRQTDPRTDPVDAKRSKPASPVDRTPRAPGSQPPTAEDDHLELPHERDQSLDSTAPAPDPGIRQAHKDLQGGLVDTDMRASPGLDAEQRARYVPGAGGRPSANEAEEAPSGPRPSRRRSG